MTTTKFFRNLDRIEEAMMRAAMPKTAERDAETIIRYVENTVRTARTLTATLREAANVR